MLHVYFIKIASKGYGYFQRPKDRIGTFLLLGTGRVNAETSGINVTSGNFAERLEHGINLFKTLVNQVWFPYGFEVTDTR